MGIRRYKPLTSSRRFAMVSDFAEITNTEPLKALTKGKPKSGGRNNQGRVTAKYSAGRNKNRLRTIDFKRDKDGVPAVVATIEYDPNRSSNIALLNYKDGEKRYIIAPAGIHKGDVIQSGDENIEIQTGNCTKLQNIPVGVPVHNIELIARRGGQVVRSAGSSANIMAKEGGFAHIKMPSGEVRLISLACRATIGTVSNADHAAIKLGKAGRNRWLGRKPRVRAVAMNPVDHPMGGGEGRTSGGRHPCSESGMPTKGYKTRKKKKSKKYILKNRRSK